ncbi:MAG: Rieske 2Fe-2S domain-containing protein [Pseudomonadota bacterium]
MKKKFIPLIKKQKLFNGFRQVFSVNDIKLLLIHINDKTYLLENKCGHFGVALDNAIIEQHQLKDIIICAQHGISFDLSTGQVVNRPWESCDPIKILECVLEEDSIGFYL